MLLLLSIAACKKDPETKDIPLQDFTFSKRLTESVTVDIYSKTDDYNNAANPHDDFQNRRTRQAHYTRQFIHKGTGILHRLVY